MEVQEEVQEVQVEEVEEVEEVQVEEVEEVQEVQEVEEVQEAEEVQEVQEVEEVEEVQEVQEVQEVEEVQEVQEEGEQEEVQEPQNIDDASMSELPGRPYKITDFKGEKRIGVIAKSLSELMDRAHVKLNIPPEVPVRVALEVDGTEVEDEDYFDTVESNTPFVILVGEERWLPNFKPSLFGADWDEPDREEKPPPHLVKLIDEVYSDLTCITLLGGKDLELLADMDPECVADLIPNEERDFFGCVKEASFRILAEKQEAKEAIQLLKLYHERHVAAAREAQKKEDE